MCIRDSWRSARLSTPGASFVPRPVGPLRRPRRPKSACGATSRGIGSLPCSPWGPGEPSVSPPSKRGGGL
eukprot:1519432-Alexandrium_andersonii.AAC.1